jgi:hypothetical protein
MPEQEGRPQPSDTLATVLAGHQPLFEESFVPFFFDKQRAFNLADEVDRLESINRTQVAVMETGKFPLLRGLAFRVLVNDVLEQTPELFRQMESLEADGERFLALCSELLQNAENAEELGLMAKEFVKLFCEGWQNVEAEMNKRKF